MKTPRLFLILLIAFPILITACGETDEPTWDPSNFVVIEPATPLNLEIPGNFPEMVVPPNNPTTVEGVELGKRLFFDPILSGDNTQACADCHAQSFAFTDNGLQFSTGIDNIEGNMNAMPIFNLGWSTDFFWDGRSVGLEAQASEPVINPIEMHEEWANVEAKLNNHPDYPGLFEDAFGTRLCTEELATMAIAQFERTLISGNSKFDKFRRNEPDGIFDQSEFNGFQFFYNEIGDCFHCHPEPLFTDNFYHNNGLDSIFDMSNEGRFGVTGDPNDIGEFKTPSLRNLAYTAPYMHDGRFNTLDEVLDHYSTGVSSSPTLDPTLYHGNRGINLNLTPDQKADLIAFLMTLNDEEFINNPDHASPFE